MLRKNSPISNEKRIFKKNLPKFAAYRVIPVTNIKGKNKKVLLVDQSNASPWTTQIPKQNKLIKLLKNIMMTHH